MTKATLLQETVQKMIYAAYFLEKNIDNIFEGNRNFKRRNIISEMVSEFL